MANYATLKAAIQQVVKTNGNNEITGALLQQTLLAMINSLGGYYQFAGIATPSTNPGTPDQNVFYIAGAGTYPNFNNAVVLEGYIGVFKYNGSWTIGTLQGGKNYDGEINQLEREFDNLIRPTEEDNPDDFYISDKNGKAIVAFKNGHIKTKNFDSSTLPSMTLQNDKLIITL